MTTKTEPSHERKRVVPRRGTTSHGRWRRRCRLRLSIAFLCAAAVAAAQEPTLQQLARGLTANALKADVSFLASDALQGRATPSPGLDIGSEFIASQFRRAGLEPAGDDGYFQTASYINVTPVTEGIEFSVDDPHGTIQVKKPAMALLQPGAADLSHRAVVKISAADAAAAAALTPEQVRGKVLILDYPEGVNTAGVNRRLLADIDRLQPAMVVALRSGGQPGNSTTRMQTAVGPPFLWVWDEAVRTALGAGKPGPVDVTVSARIPAPVQVPVKLHNVAGVLRGSDPALRDTYVLLTAHYDHLGVRGTGEGDHIFNGANDDASGTAAVIEAAAALAAAPARPRRGILFAAWFGEEKGLLGSRYYVAHPLFPLAKTIADINLEQLGRTDSSDGPQMSNATFTGYDYSSVPLAFERAGKDLGIRVYKDEKRSDSFFGRSDNQPFAGAGVPAHTMTVSYEYADYHGVADHWDKIDYDNMARVVRLIALGLLSLADGSEAPRWNESNPRAAPYRK
jgi:hypothetical protein